MAKKALCVGINDYPGTANDLQGCVNDAQGWAEALTTHFGFPAADVKLLLNAQATKAIVLANLKALLAGAQSGDILVFTNSSHGTYVPDTSGDEPKYDEAMCPYDIPNHLIVDDELRTIFATIPDGVRVTVISDSCFSGTVTRVVNQDPDRRPRWLDPELLGRPFLKPAQFTVAHPRSAEKYPQSKMKEILLSGCTDKEYSYDANIGGTFHGAMSYYALQVIREANYRITYATLHKRLLQQLAKEGYDQHPQLEGKAANKRRLIFS